MELIHLLIICVQLILTIIIWTAPIGYCSSNNIIKDIMKNDYENKIDDNMHLGKYT